MGLPELSALLSMVQLDIQEADVCLGPHICRLLFLLKVASYVHASMLSLKLLPPVMSHITDDSGLPGYEDIQASAGCQPGSDEQ